VAAESPRIAELRRRVDSDPSSIAFAQLAEEYRRAGQFAAAEQCCRTGLARHPAYLSARVTLGRTLIELNKLDEAELELEQVLKAAPDNLAAIRGVAEIHQRHGRLDAALEYYGRALTLARHDPELEEIVATLNRELATSQQAPPVDEATTDFDKLLDSLGLAGHSAPPAVEALLNDTPQAPDAGGTAAGESSQSSLDRLQSLVDSLSAFDREPASDERALLDPQTSAEPQPDWMVGPLPNIVAPVDVSGPAPLDGSSLADDVATEVPSPESPDVLSATAATDDLSEPATPHEGDYRTEPEDLAAAGGESPVSDAELSSLFAPEAAALNSGQTAAASSPDESLSSAEAASAFAPEESTLSSGETWLVAANEESAASAEEADFAFPSEESDLTDGEPAAVAVEESGPSHGESQSAATLVLPASDDGITTNLPRGPEAGPDTVVSEAERELDVAAAPVGNEESEHRSDPDASDAPVVSDVDQLAGRDRVILEELEAWLDAIRR
jgi:hypothetical protein